MKQIIAQQHTRFFMARHGLDGWNVCFDRAVRRLGQCRYSLKQLSFSIKFLLILSDKEIIDVILHEIAHALTKGAGHGRVWKQKCVEIGANPNRLYKGLASVEKKYVAVCPKCGTKLQIQRLGRRFKYGKTHHTPCREKVNNILEISLAFKLNPNYK